MTRDLISEVAEACEDWWAYHPGTPREAIDHVLRERFEVRWGRFGADVPGGTLWADKLALVSRPVAPVPTVAEAARALVDWLEPRFRGISGTPLMVPGFQERMDALRAALKEEGKR